MSHHHSRRQADLAVYIGNGLGGDISVLRLSGKSGTLSPIQRMPFPGVTQPGRSLPLALSPGREFLYAAMRGRHAASQPSESTRPQVPCANWALRR